MADLKEIVILATLEDYIKNTKPSLPVYTVKPRVLKDKAEQFLTGFGGKVLYSVKSNPSVSTLNHLYSAGITTFDVASLSEIKLIDSLFPAKRELYFMHPIKSREAIRESYFQYGVRDYSLDTLDELHKILEETNYATDLGLHVRIATADSDSIFNLSSKFGIAPNDAAQLILETRKAAHRFGVCFHVGSQCMNSDAYIKALGTVRSLIKSTAVQLDVVDVGGGFPAKYPTMNPQALPLYLTRINEAIEELRVDLQSNFEAWCEPGRALVVESGSLVVRVEGKKQHTLFLNDGTYGGLFDAGFPGFIYPTKAIRTDTTFSTSGQLSEDLEDFSFYGPTCDSMDAMKGPFLLPSNIGEGDYIELGQLGAYSKSIRTDFNGFADCLEIELF